MSEPNERRLLTPEEYLAAQASPEFVELKRRFRRFAFPMTVAFLAWYLLYVLLSTYAHDFMSTEVFGNVNVGLIFGLLQFVSTFVITHLYVAAREQEHRPDRRRDARPARGPRVRAPATGTGTTEGATRG